MKALQINTDPEVEVVFNNYPAFNFPQQTIQHTK